MPDKRRILEQICGGGAGGVATDPWMVFQLSEFELTTKLVEVGT